MTISEVLDKVHQNINHSMTNAQLIEWINELEQSIFENLLVFYEDAPCRPKAYTVDDMEKRLFLPFPHDKLYYMYISQEINKQNYEYERYNNDVIAFNNDMEVFQRFWNRTHKHLPIILKGTNTAPGK